MKYKSVKYYIGRLISDGQKWQNMNINGKEVKPICYFSKIQFILIFISISMVFFVTKNGFNKDFIGYIIASLSIFIGLFLTLVLTIFDKFQKINFEQINLSDKDKIILIQRKNFFKQFTALTSYSILLSTLCIFLLSLSLLMDILKVNIYNFKIIKSIEDINCKNFLNGVGLFFIVVYRISVLYFLLDFFLMILYVLSSIYTYITLEFDRKKIS
ncbi:hypothetical protein ACQ1Q1_08295 [Ornithobacterium rhinotracheale]|uniref:Uncharacterized protein n=1 Tax=Ornithobacterium rhinotracheale (strain ATCC 51463 / DSM 15997 / CCUG 23171 / CIP 104009 / LMG 9086) TaxID=867902 RepID=I4A2I5_ORNRL|nr:hypothetical protein [Ornithobacterium rhinotracheale]AFL98169.1 hypothetical protein Ornrh_2034 [Ornithobacterium rhinotracheale DSM 15997]AIQ00698.1 hypothetical protein Q785_10055 [Ornithobacterium rhinotracheale ORT-UMN 88]KGB66356.1 hypothetical protein Q787_09885 [Ornithobacterium rhinotracheale H06-030791]MCK0201529.1 hypothetical protein [Ornithobacterium rhinotracheale]UOH63589.1 hypothetical protein MT993_11355 [Ornithobacterium rhinotracheale]